MIKTAINKIFGKKTQEEVLTFSEDVQEVEIFKAGDYGDKGKYSEADIEQIAKDYNPAIHEAPITLDHKQTGPAYGWVEGIKAVGGKLIAKIKDVQPAFMEALQKGLYKKKSVELYKTFKGTGRPYLRALTFLGAQVPEVKGLADLQFKDDGEFLEFEDMYEYPLSEKSLRDKIKEEIYYLRNSIVAEMITEQYKSKIREIVSGIIDSEFQNRIKEFSEKLNTIPKGEKDMPKEEKTPEEKKETPVEVVKNFSEADVQRLVAEAEAKTRQAVEAEQEVKLQAKIAREKSVSEFSHFCETQKAAGKLTKAQEDIAVAIHTGLIDKAETVSFSEGDKKQDVSLSDMFKKFVGSLPEQVKFGEVVQGGEKRLATAVNYGESVDPESLAIAEKAKKIFEEKKGTISFREALIEAAKI